MNDLRCATCGEPFDSAWKLCQACGTPLHDLSVCPGGTEHEAKQEGERQAAEEQTLRCENHRQQDGDELPRNPSPLEIWLNPKDDLEYVFIPPGSFEMGAGPGESIADEERRRRVEIAEGFWLCRTPVTVGAYRRFCVGSGWQMRVAPDFDPSWQHEDCPIVGVDWNDAMAYCEWLGGRLPTEAEWEYAARAGTGTRYWWGSGIDSGCAWHANNSGGHPQPVGRKRANPWGLYDTLGNVAQWCLCAHLYFWDLEEGGVSRTWKRGQSNAPPNARPGVDRFVKRRSA